MSPAPRRKITDGRPTAIGSKATTPSQASRAQASRNGGAATRAGKGARTVDWDAVIKRFKRDMAERAAESDSEGRSAMGTPTKGVSSLPDGSLGQESLSEIDREGGRMMEPPLGDHPHTDPGDGRTECEICGKWVHECIHSCKGVPVTEAAMRRLEARVAEARR